MPYRILAINPGSTSTKIAVFENEQELFSETLRHSAEELKPYASIMDQYEFRQKVILDTLKTHAVKELHAVVGRGGLLKPMSGGTYAVNASMLADLKAAIRGEHASNLGALLAHEISKTYSVPAYIVDPVVVDEMQEIARFSGMPEIQRTSIFHALNQKAIARRASNDLGKRYEEVNLIVVHLGGGISVGAHEKGKIIDVNNALDGEGAFSPERSGGLPAGDLMRLCFSGRFTQNEIKKKITGNGGLVAYLGTNSGIEINEKINAGDEQAKLVYQAMAYQVSKDVGALSAVLKGKIDVIAITGGLAYDTVFTGWIADRISYLGKVVFYPGEDELLALTQGTLRVLTGEEKPKEYR